MKETFYSQIEILSYQQVLLCNNTPCLRSKEFQNTPSFGTSLNLIFSSILSLDHRQRINIQNLMMVFKFNKKQIMASDDTENPYKHYSNKEIANQYYLVYQQLIQDQQK
ncbi:hypothetical protein ABPG74_019070 [Tetrahymena malaccensis]